MAEGHSNKSQMETSLFVGKVETQVELAKPILTRFRNEFSPRNLKNIDVTVSSLFLYQD